MDLMPRPHARALYHRDTETRALSLQGDVVRGASLDVHLQETSDERARAAADAPRA